MQGLLLIVATMVVFILGYWLRVLGTPYNTILLAIHKLLAVVGIIVVGVHVYKVMQTIEPGGSTYLLIALTLIFAVATLATGGILSAIDSPKPIVLWSHRLLPYLALVFLTMSYMLGRNSA